MALNISRWFRRLSVAASLLGLLFWLFMAPPVIVDTFDPKHPRTIWDVLAVNLPFGFLFVCVPAMVVLLIGAAVARLRNRN
jgi:hypothetical protein